MSVRLKQWINAVAARLDRPDGRERWRRTLAAHLGGVDPLTYAAALRVRSYLHRRGHEPDARALYYGLGAGVADMLVAHDSALLVPADDVIGAEAFAAGGFQPEHLDATMAVLAEHHPIDPTVSVFLDVGANIGSSSVDAVVRHGFARAIGFEPHPLTARIARANAALAGIEDRVTIHQVGLSDRCGTLPLEIDVENAGDNRIRMTAEDGLHGEAGRRTIDVPVSTLDAEVEPEGVGLVWMDVQGHEAHVLAGASRLLAARVPWLVEYAPYMLDRAGALDRFEAIVAEHFAAFVDVRDRSPRVRPSAEIGRRKAEPFGGTTVGHEHTDLLLLP